MLPGPRLVLLVAGESFHGADQQAGFAGGTQPHVHFIELAGDGIGAQHHDDALRQPRVELAAVDAALPLDRHRVLIQRTVVQEYQIEIRDVAEFEAA